MDAERPFWETAVVYQIYVRSFKDSDGDGIGDLAGIIEKLDYLSGILRVDAIWVTPFYPSPMADFGYDVSDHTDVHPLFGDLETFDRLVATTHAAGLRLIIDFVPNHTSEQHAWFAESRSSRDSARRNWYVWRDPKPDGAPPNNWLSVFGGPAWTLDEATGQYYLHSFLPQQPDLDWRNPDVRAAMLDAMRFWLDRGVDGFRIDAPPFLMKDPLERDNPPNPGSGAHGHKPLGAYDSQVHLYDQRHPDLHDVLREMRGVLEGYDPPRMAIGEIHEFDPTALMRYYGEVLDQLQLTANFALMNAPWTAAGVRGAVDALEGVRPDGAWLNWVLGSHDDQRIATRLGDAESRQAAVLLLTLRGTPTLYYGDEVGMRQAEIPPDQQQDPWGRAEPGLGRDGARTPMQWTAGYQAGFTTGSTTWLPIPQNYRNHNVDSQLGDPDSHLELYRRLLRFRRRSRALQRGGYRSLPDVPDPVYLYERAVDGERALVAINFSDRTVELELAVDGKVRVSTHASGEGRRVEGEIQLQPREALILV